MSFFKSNLREDFRQAESNKLNAAITKFFKDLPDALEKARLAENKPIELRIDNEGSDGTYRQIYRTEAFKKLEDYCRKNDYRLRVETDADYIYGSITVYPDQKYTSRFSRNVGIVSWKLNNFVFGTEA